MLRERGSLQFNTSRVWLLNKSVVGRRDKEWGAKDYQDEGIHPDMFPNFYDALRRFVDLSQSYGLAPELTVFTQTQTLMPDYDDQCRHLDRTIAAVQGAGAVLVELVNENDQHDNGVDPRILAMDPSGEVIFSNGSNGADMDPVQPVRDYGHYHIIDGEWQRKVGHNGMEVADRTGRACLTGETQRYPDNETSTTRAYDAARAAALLCAGSCFHSQSGKFSTLFRGVERDAAAAWVQGALSVDLEFQAGAYHHRVDLETGNVIRAYDRQLGDGRRFEVVIRA